MATTSTLFILANYAFEAIPKTPSLEPPPVDKGANLFFTIFHALSFYFSSLLNPSLNEP